jgi:hypothetical protein
MIDSIPQPWTVRGRSFSRDELLQIRAIVDASPHDPRSLLSRRICEAFDWRQPNGRLKDRSCREVLLRLHDLAFLKLPPRRVEARRRRPIPITARTDPRVPRPFSPRDLDGAAFFVVTRSRSRALEQLWNEYVERYHYLRFGVPVGPHIKYFVRLGDEPIACLAFSGAAWKVASRDRWIGWSRAQREKHLRFIVNNSRFLIFPWIRVKNLASRILSLALHRLPGDWQRLYAYRPLLVETFVHANRHAGICYRAANWVCVGVTEGRGKTDRYHNTRLPKKLVFLSPLAHNARQALAAMPDNRDT